MSNLLFDKVVIGNVFDNIIANHLTIKDIYNMSFVDHELFNRINETYIINQIKKRIIARLKYTFRNNYDAVVVAMIQSEAVLSGSFVLQCILSEKWNNSDIDLYVKNEKHEEAMKKVFNLLTNDMDDYDSGYRAQEIKKITNYYCSSTFLSYKIQLVRIDVSKKYSLWDHINNTGFDICKNEVYFNKNKNLQVRLSNFKEIIH
ncbi:MAG: hypothetical protein MUO21_08455, partial [Nitrososphaeraceae archaeon]|nr:hypothetical protein [Nitrososphaeraceae archaeon]